MQHQTKRKAYENNSAICHGQLDGESCSPGLPFLPCSFHGFQASGNHIVSLRSSEKSLSFCYLRGFTETSQNSTNLIFAASSLLTRVLQTCPVLRSRTSLIRGARLQQSWGGTCSSPPSGGLQLTWSTAARTRQPSSFLFSCLVTLL